MSTYTQMPKGKKQAAKSKKGATNSEGKQEKSYCLHSSSIICPLYNSTTGVNLCTSLAAAEAREIAKTDVGLRDELRDFGKGGRRTFYYDANTNKYKLESLG